MKYFISRLSEGSKDKEGSSASGSTRAQSEGPGGIIHSVQILTGTGIIIIVIIIIQSLFKSSRLQL